MSTSSFSRRHFFHPLGSAALAALASRAFAEATPKPSKILFFSRAGTTEHDIVHRDGSKLSEGERLMIEMGRRLGVSVECEKDGGVFDHDLSRFAGFVLFWNYDPTKPNARGEPPVSEQGRQRLIEAVASGRGLVGIHCAAYAYFSGKQETWQTAEHRDPYTRMLGGELCGCLAKQRCRYRIVSPAFPGVSRLNASAIALDDEPYGLKNFADDLHVIAVMETDGLDTNTRKDKTFPRPAFPCIWARRHERGRVFYTSMGHDKDAWRAGAFQDIVQGGLAWAIGQTDADLTPNLKTTAPGAGQLPTT
jgi:type 1 glutamine amidotransferase